MSDPEKIHAAAKEANGTYGDGVPRKNNLETMVPAEKAIFAAAQEVEKLPPSPLLTDAINLLHQARDKVAEYVDNFGKE